MLAVTALSVVAGGALIVFVGVDVFLTSLAPTARAPLNELVSRALWRIARLARGRARPAALRNVGPLSIVVTVVIWLALLWLGYALLYAPFTDALAWSSDVPDPPAGWAAALYLSGTSLTTLGFGDVVAASAPLRTLTVMEAAAGLGIITATLGYLPAIYTIISEVRSANQRVSDLQVDRIEAAAPLLAADAPRLLDDVRRDVVNARQHFLRFPVLHYFHPPYDESVVALARGARGLWLASAEPAAGDPVLARHRQALERAVDRLMDTLAQHAAGLPVPQPQRPPAQSLDDAARRGVLRWDEVVNRYADVHEYPHRRQPAPAEDQR